MQTLSGTEENIRRIAELFPSCVTEVSRNGKTEQAIDFDALRRELQDTLAEDGEERYQFTWPDKRKAKRLAHTKINATLRPCREESVDFDTTHNLYIEGDNLDVLKCLKETYSGQVKMIYIDPPYNTGNDFVYEDDFSESAADYLAHSGQYDDQGNRLVTNKESNGRFHTDWLNMIYPRLIVARDLLTEDGVIFISIDDHEVANIRKVCDEIFGECNFEGHIHFRRRHNQPNDKTKMIGVVAEHIICFAKNSQYLKTVGVGKLDITANFTNPDNDPKGSWASKPWKVGSDQSGSSYRIISPTGKVFDGEWMGEESTYKRLLEEGRIYFPKGGDGFPRKKYYAVEREEEGQCATNWWSHEQFGHNQGANDYATALFGKKNSFSNPKPVELLKGILKIGNVKKEDIILDFFSGSATTADAVMQLNAEDGGNRRFIMVQLPELTDEKSEAYKAGYKNICEIGKERIRRAGAKIKADNPLTTQDLDTGFRVLKLAESNMLDVFYTPAELRQDDLFSLADNIRPDRTSEDLLFQVMLELGATLDSKIEVLHNADLGLTDCPKQYTVFRVADNYLLACFDTEVTDTVVTAIARLQPQYAVLRDSSLTDDATATNFEQLFRTYAPNTTCRVL